MSLSITETRDIALCQSLRRIVFIEEQGVSVEDEVDGRDDSARHLLAQLDGTPVGTARLLTDGSTGKIGRVCVLPQARGNHVGQELIRAAIATFRATPGLNQAKLGAQTHALGFYAALGFTAVGEVYIDAGIPHRDMVLPLT